MGWQDIVKIGLDVGNLASNLTGSILNAKTQQDAIKQQRAELEATQKNLADSNAKQEKAENNAVSASSNLDSKKQENNGNNNNTLGATSLSGNLSTNSPLSSY